MSSKLDQSLDSIISSERSATRGSKRGGRGGGAASNGSGPVRNARSRPSTGPYQQQQYQQRGAGGMVAGFSTPYVDNTAAHLAAAQFAAMQQQQQQQIAMQQQAAQKLAAQQRQRQQQQQQQQQQTANEPATKKIVGDTIHVTNLASDVKSEELKEIFSQVGAIKSATVNYSENGVSMGTATVTFRRHADADKAVSEYDGAEIDGKAMSCKLIGSVSSGPVVVKKKKSQQAPQQQLQQNAGAPQLPPGFVAVNPLLAAPFSFPATAAAGFPLQPNFNASVFNQTGFPSAFNQFNNQRGGGARQPQQQYQQQQQQSMRGGGQGGRGGQAGGRGGRGGAGGRGGRGGRGGGGAGGRGPQKEPSAADLDAELDSYHGGKESEETKTE